MEDKGLIKTAYLCFVTSLSECLGLNDMINELGRVWKEEVVATFEIGVLEFTWRDRGKPRKYLARGSYSGRDLN